MSDIEILKSNIEVCFGMIADCQAVSPFGQKLLLTDLIESRLSKLIVRYPLVKLTCDSSLYTPLLFIAAGASVLASFRSELCPLGYALGVLQYQLEVAYGFLSDMYKQRK